MSIPVSRSWHAVTAVVAVFALALQLVLVWTGDAVLAETAVPGLALRVGRFASYFTIQANLLVAVSAVTLARDPWRDGAGWRVLRLAAVVGITVTGLVHFFLLRPLLHLHGWSAVADTLLHLVVPVLAVLGWVLFGPRPRVTLRAAGLALLWPVAWLAWSLSMGAASGWFPYPFLDYRTEGWAHVLAVCLGVTAMFLALTAAVGLIDRRALASDA